MTPSPASVASVFIGFCVHICVQNVSKIYEWILTKIFGEVEHALFGILVSRKSCLEILSEYKNTV